MTHKLLTLWQDNKSLVVFITLMMFFRSAVADWNDVPTGSMKPTIVEGDRILINKMAYDLHLPFSQLSLLKIADPVRNDIIIFESKVAEKRLVKRVIAVPGDRVALINNQLLLNGEVAQYTSSANEDGSYSSIESINGASHSIRTHAAPGSTTPSELSSFAEITVPAGYYLAMGDNRDDSADSRVIGLVPRAEIIGRSSKVVLSLDYDQYLLPRTERFLKEI